MNYRLLIISTAAAAMLCMFANRGMAGDKTPMECPPGSIYEEDAGHLKRCIPFGRAVDPGPLSDPQSCSTESECPKDKHCDRTVHLQSAPDKGICRDVK